MYSFHRLTQVYNSSKVIPFDNTSKFIFFSDCHRGDNSWADDFTKNEELFLAALDFYYQENFTYIEIGDGDELWENYLFYVIRKAHSKVFSVVKKFHDDNRLLMLNGNHDVVKRCRRFVKYNLHVYRCESNNRIQPFMNNLEVHEGLVLKHKETEGKLFVVHGHQGDLLNDCFWPFARFLTRHIWRQLEVLGIKNLFSPAKFNPRKGVVEGNIINWIRRQKQAVIAGHTHRSMYPSKGMPPYFNTGCCVSSDGITGIEIQNGEITLIKWIKEKAENDNSSIKKLVLAGPEKLTVFL